MKASPFLYGNTVSDQAFTNREVEIRRLVENLSQGINTTIISPRRWGKSSLVEKVAGKIRKAEKGTKVVMIDLYTAAGIREFLEIFAREVVRASSGRWQDWVRTLKDGFKQVIPRISMGADPYTDFSISFDFEELVRHSEEILDLPERICKRKGIKMIICLDEFQNLAGFDGYEDFEKKIRAVWQRQKSVTYCLYGSKRHMMSQIFNNPSKPFYKFGDILMLPRIAIDKWATFIVASFQATGKNISPELAAGLAGHMRGHSWYVQQLAHYTWNNCPRNANAGHINEALDELIRANQPFFQKIAESLSGTRHNLVRAIARGEMQLTSKRVMDEFKIGTPRNVSKNILKLVQEDIIDDNADGYEFLDPVFELWFKWQFFGEPYELKI